MKVFLASVAIVFLGLIACGGGPEGPAHDNSTWYCWNKDSAMDQAVGPFPHSKQPGEQNSMLCTVSQFYGAGWYFDSDRKIWRPRTS